MIWSNEIVMEFWVGVGGVVQWVNVSQLPFINMLREPLTPQSVQKIINPSGGEAIASL